MGLKKWHNTILQLREFFGITFAAEDVVADLRQASRRGKTNIACTND
jgi:hypothetical protein